MHESNKIHILSQELIVMFDELEDEAQKIVHEHMKECRECQKLYDNLQMKAIVYNDFHDSDKLEIKPLKKIIHFHQGLKIMFFAVRLALISFILFTSFHFYNWELSSKAALEFIKGAVFFFYFPSIIFLTVFAFAFFNKKWVWLLILFDFIIIFFLDVIIAIFI
ncbi:hypothetical protein [Bacillus ndiopicus]|uniref:hypothetical protein n=1 Tax=Bacillus ndiopicus TaxID=1347368 RepID=UPI0005A8CA5F|nr:hypothetical protein [Bacillus ndiopicus]